jgi:phosphatidylethanolamine-binding protein (PEBP) family uncharacterized protein
MKRFIYCAVLLCSVVATSPASIIAHEGHDHFSFQPILRTWTIEKDKSQFEGGYVSAKDGFVQIRRVNGKVVSLTIKDLCQEDQKFVAEKLAVISEMNQRMPSAIRLVSTAVKEDKSSAIVRTFETFAKLKEVTYRQDNDFFYVESIGMPNHQMMVGITAWQQQVPLPQSYRGDNAWRIPLHPVPAKEPMSAKEHFFRGAIAIAANGIPIFNPIKNDGRTDTLVAGELDEFGGHCGRADDYHYHIAPTHLQKILGNDLPVAYALDGYPIYGFTEPDGSPVGKLDEFNGHSSPELGYHYHATKKYPYLNGGFHGEVVERDGQVDPQPRATGVRPALPPMRGAKITGFKALENKRYSLQYTVDGANGYVNYQLKDNGSVDFEFVDTRGNKTTETFTARGNQRGPGGGNAGGGGPQGRGRPGEGGSDASRPPRGGRGGQQPPPGEGGGGRPGEGGSDAPRPPRGGRGGQQPPPGEGERGGQQPPGGGRRGGQQPPPAGDVPLVSAKDWADWKPARSGKMKLLSSAVENGKQLPIEFNGDGEGATLPLEWSGFPSQSQSFALVMDHITKDEEIKSYWVIWDIPANTTSLAKNVEGVGRYGATWKRGETYIPPHSQGPGEKVYTLTVYALSSKPKFDKPDGEVTREMLLKAIKPMILDSAELKVLYSKPGGSQQNRNASQPPPRGEKRP